MAPGGGRAAVCRGGANRLDSRAMNVIIAGGGIGGLTLALCLDHAGIECEVYEAAPEFKPLGVGINLLPHSVRVLTILGLQHELATSCSSHEGC